MTRLKIFFHANCFDGAATAALFADFYRREVAPDATIDLQGVHHRRGDPFEGLALDGDDNACVDFRYCASDRMTWWFDHHASAFQPSELRAHFEADQSGQKFFDPTARSCAAFAERVLLDHFGYRPPEAFREVLDWADVIDGAQFDSAKVAVELDAPALELMTWIENNRDPERARQFIGELGRRPLAAIAAEPWIREALSPLLAAHERNIELIRRRAEFEGGVVYFDLTEDEVAAHNKFISYYLFPEAQYTVGLTRSPERTKVSVGCNPWTTRPREHDISAICERFGGGGHPVVGAVTLAGDQRNRAREIAAEIRAELRTP